MRQPFKADQIWTQKLQILINLYYKVAITDSCKSEYASLLPTFILKKTKEGQVSNSQIPFLLLAQISLIWAFPWLQLFFLLHVIFTAH